LAISEFMEKHKGVSPETWLGSRNIDEKEEAPSLSFARPNFDEELLDDENEEIEDGDSLKS